MVAVLVATALVPLAAMANPFGAPAGGADAAPAVSPWLAWIVTQEATFYRMLSDAICGARLHDSAVAGLIAISFVYGIFHAAGPGHGKAVISSYLVANRETWRRGLLLSAASALLQAVTAVLIVTVAAWLLNATAQQIGQTLRLVETASYGLVILIGVRLLWVKGQALAGMLRARAAAWAPAFARPAIAWSPAGHNRAGRSVPADNPFASACVSCGAVHGPELAAAAGSGRWRRELAAVVAVGLRPCSGAILVLVFALGQGLYGTGIAATFAMGLGTAVTVAAVASFTVAARGLATRLAATRDGSGALIVCGLELFGAALIILFGMFLLTGYMAAERMFGV